MASTGIDLGKRREELKLSRSDLAKKVGTTRLRVWRIETGVTRLPPKEAPIWAKALKLKEVDLLRSLAA